MPKVLIEIRQGGQAAILKMDDSGKIAGEATLDYTTRVHPDFRYRTCQSFDLSSLMDALKKLGSLKQAPASNKTSKGKGSPTPSKVVTKGRQPGAKSGDRDAKPGSTDSRVQPD